MGPLSRPSGRRRAGTAERDLDIRPRLAHLVAMTRFILPAVLAASIPQVALAFAVETVVVGKVRRHLQFDAQAVGPLAPAAGPFEFFAAVGGGNLDDIVPPRVTGPINNAAPGHHAGELGFRLEANEWGYGAPDFDGWRTGSQGDLDALFGNGTYSVRVTGSDIAITLAGDLYPSTNPRVEVSGGAWIADGVYRVREGAPVTLSIEQFGEFRQHALGILSLTASRGSEWFEEMRTSRDSANGRLVLAIAEGSLQPGGDFLVSAWFASASTFRLGIAGDPSAAIAGVYANETRFALRVTDIADLDADGRVSGSDLGLLLGEWGQCGSCDADLNGDGTVSGADLGLLLGRWTA